MNLKILLRGDLPESGDFAAGRESSGAEKNPRALDEAKLSKEIEQTLDRGDYRRG